MRSILTDQLSLVAFTAAAGLVLGRIRFRQFSLGSSGSLFIGLFAGWLTIRTAGTEEKAEVIAGGVVGNEIFRLALALFIAAIALSSARHLGKVIKVYGFRLLVLGALVPLAGAAAAYGLARVIPGVDPETVTGVFNGAMTSSPGLAAALEQVAHRGTVAESAVGFGYAVGYIPGVLVVVLGMQLIPLVFGLDASRENKAFCEDLDIDPEEQNLETSGKFRPLEFFLVIALGYLIGSVTVPMGSWGRIGLGATGGILAAGLVLGCKGKTGPLDFRMPAAPLAAVRELGIVLFLSVVGLRYGYEAVTSMSRGGLPLLCLSLAVALLSLISGYFFGRYVLKLNWILLSGSICGAMTSTPGLGAAVEATGCDDVATGYGAVYPVALLSMVIFTIVLSAI
jgi:putative transport protein